MHPTGRRWKTVCVANFDPVLTSLSLSLPLSLSTLSFVLFVCRTVDGTPFDLFSFYFFTSNSYPLSHSRTIPCLRLFAYVNTLNFRIGVPSSSWVCLVTGSVDPPRLPHLLPFENFHSLFIFPHSIHFSLGRKKVFISGVVQFLLLSQHVRRGLFHLIIRSYLFLIAKKMKTVNPRPLTSIAVIPGQQLRKFQTSVEERLFWHMVQDDSDVWIRITCVFTTMCHDSPIVVGVFYTGIDPLLEWLFDNVLLHVLTEC